MTMARILVDGRPYDVNGGQNLLHACLSAGLNLPYFCWHPALGSVGACRQCAVKQFKDEKDTNGKLVMACMTPAADGTRISIDDPEAHDFRARIIEWLMVNHPHDCPVCDEGGECHLQDMTVMTGHAYRRFRFRKRTFRNQDLGPFINHEMNRCITCYRCVRFYRDYAGGRDLHALAAHDHVYFGRVADGTLENEFSGNLVEVCPTGVFTDKTLKRHYTRKWDLQSAPSVCVHCGVGCNTIAAERYGGLRRILNRYNRHVNGYFLCDRGRFGYEFVNAARRIREPAMRAQGDGRPPSSTHETALRHAASLLHDPARIIGIGSPRASLEANYALRTLVGPERFHLGVAEAELRSLRRILRVAREGAAPLASLRDVERADATLVLGEDVPDTAPRLALSLRQAVRRRSFEMAAAIKVPDWNDAAVREVAQSEHSPLFIAAPAATRLDDIAAESFRAAPDDIARLGFAVAREIDAGASDVRDADGALRQRARRVAAALRRAERPLIVSGTSLGDERIVAAAANVAAALRKDGTAASLAFAVPECNSLGLAMLEGAGLDDAFRALREGQVDVAVVLENDLYRRAERSSVDAFFAAARHVIAIDALWNETSERADIVLPAATFAEGDGTLVSGEGRAQRFFQVFVPDGDVRESWRWLRDLMTAAGRDEIGAWSSLDHVTGELSRLLPQLGGAAEAAPPSTLRILGQRVPRQPHRYSGRTAMNAAASVHEPKPPADPDSPLAFSMEGTSREPPAALVPFAWAPGWNSAQAWNKFQSEVGGEMRGGDAGRRLLEPRPDGEAAYSGSIPPAFAPRTDAWLLVPLPQVFGSDELSNLAPAVETRIPPPFVALPADEAAALGFCEDDEALVTVAGREYALRVRTGHGLPRGVAGLPTGLPALTGLHLPAWGTLRRTRT
jgi:NADH-quinone oxidoreductase subunit G